MSRTTIGVSIVAGNRATAWWRACVVVVSIFTLPVPAAADVVTSWNLVAERVAPRFGGPQPQSRVMAMAHIAVHNAVVARIDRG